MTRCESAEPVNVSPFVKGGFRVPKIARALERVESTPSASARRAAADALLFAGPHILIDADNKCGGVVASTAEARAAVAAGRAATWASQVTPAVAAVDVDLDHEGLAQLVVDELASWAARRGLWHLCRPSGGGPGRWHVLIVIGPHSAALDELLAAWRADARLSARELDRRATIRPLEAPHRRYGPQETPELDTPALRRALRCVGRILSDVPATPVAHADDRDAWSRPAPRATARRRPIDALAPFQPHSRARCASRSEHEFSLTVQLHNQGADADAAWRVVESVEHGKAAGRGRRWWERHMWERVRPRERTGRLDLDAVVLPVIAGSRHRYASLDTRQRHSLESVLLLLLGRLTLASSGAVAVSQRDLWLCTGLRPSTARAAANRAVELGLLTATKERRQDAGMVYQLGPAATSLIDPSTLTPTRTCPTPWTWLPHCPPGTASTALDHWLNTAPTPKLSTRQRQLHSARATALHERAVLAPSEHQHRAADAQAWARRLAVVSGERDRFYEGLRRHRAAQRQAWHQRVLDRRARQDRWWRALSGPERAVRQAARRAALARMRPEERAAHLATLEARRERLRVIRRHERGIEPPLPLPLPSGLPW